MSTKGKTAHTVSEFRRTYHWPDGSSVSLDHVTEVIISDTTHRLKTKDQYGMTILHIIPNGWNHIEIAADDWSF
jgi:hypothetical protein